MQMSNDKEKTEYNFTFTDGLANGVFRHENKKNTAEIVFTDGMAKIENDGNIDVEAKFSINQNTWMITMESFVDGKSYSKTEKFLGIKSICGSNVWGQDTSPKKIITYIASRSFLCPTNASSIPMFFSFPCRTPPINLYSARIPLFCLNLIAVYFILPY